MRTVAATLALFLLAAVPTPAGATLPRENACYEILCTSFVMTMIAETDRTYHRGADDKQILIVRFEDGSTARILAEWVAGEVCRGWGPDSRRIRSAILVRESARAVTTQGCLTSSAAQRFLRVTLELNSTVLPADRLMYLLDPQVRVPAVSRTGYVFGRLYDLGSLVLTPPPDES